MPDTPNDQQEPSQSHQEPTEGPAPTSDTPETPTEAQEPRTYDEDYVKALRDEAAGHRVKAKRADTLAAALVTSIAAGTGKLVDPRDLPHGEHLLGEDGLPDPEKIGAAIDVLIRERPHLASRRPTGHLEQGARPDEPGLSLLGLLRGTG